MTLVPFLSCFVHLVGTDVLQITSINETAVRANVQHVSSVDDGVLGYKVALMF